MKSPWQGGLTGITLGTIVAELVARLVQFSTLRLILGMWGAALLAGVVVVALAFVLFEFGWLNEEAMGGDFLVSLSFAGLVVVALIVAPIFETLMFQWGLLPLVKMLTRKIAKSDSWLPALLVTSLAFAAMHAGNAVDAGTVEGLAHVLFRIPVAFLLTLLAIVERHREVGYPVLGVMLLHSLNNLAPTLAIAFS